MSTDPTSTASSTERLTPKDVIDGCQWQAEIQYRSWNDRRPYEWRLTVAFWTLTVAAAAFSIQQGGVDRSLFALFTSLGILIYLRWLYGIWRANEYDRLSFFYYRSKAREVLKAGTSTGLSVEPFAEPSSEALGWVKFIGNWSMRTHLTITLLLAVFAYILIGSRRSEKADPAVSAADAARATASAVAENTKALEALRQQFQGLTTGERQATVPPAQRKR